MRTPRAPLFDAVSSFSIDPPTTLTSFPLQSSRPHRDLHPFPTRRSSDLSRPAPARSPRPRPIVRYILSLVFFSSVDRKSTRLNSSHVAISYAVFCLKKKKKNGKCIWLTSGGSRLIALVVLLTSVLIGPL